MPSRRNRFSSSSSLSPFSTKKYALYRISAASPGQLVNRSACLNYFVEERMSKFWATFLISKKVTKVNNRPIGEILPNLVTLLEQIVTKPKK
jgi:hypothetical protein